MPITTDVLVIGGGATGTGIARDLTLRGVDVTLAERGGLSAGTTGRSHGLLHSGARYAEADAEGALECLEENQILREIAGECIRETRGLFVQVAGDDSAYFDEKRAACEELGIPVEVVDGDDAREAVSGLAAAVERAMWVPDAVVLPSRLVAATAADAREHGARILTHAPVESMVLEGERIDSVSLGGAAETVVEPEFVVNATGPHAGAVAAMAGVTVEMRPTRGVMVSVDHDGLEPVLNRCRDPADGDIIVPHDDEVVLGTTSVPVDDLDEFERDQQEVERTIRECATMLPAVADAPQVRTWWGIRPLYEPDEAARGGRGISRGFVQLDHAEDGVANFVSIVGGKLTTYRRMAESVSDLVADRLGVGNSSTTAGRELIGASSASELDAFVDEFDGRGPTDADLVDQDG
ncbi:glycerol-3-phosphate dehydrogenase subunit A [Natrialba magadii ATCC 43099]|uniref:Glycerol-3-phosphate dehydrogenase n=1 Tax=Natrialba magadii (strain ATCC 43099 / DSM 3394 / CCM 3739 / CIP 104546 / IAM 13178 / JCM 8861 / NBRC 102185 / NCIMB 2190 / MS3) TaxID=547559 RepID=D3SR72_NATMM|nr:FAD-dependent oxidoreductase [Natrialba magadii]ADD06628.1 glycerol-3-phosphate dehydrogenase subunit A [Natrialba magadii ATCC 43099]ELY31911.1 glycerol-3-phosphate dehydrogenase [Natrialba magadii ATCC 43099]